MSPILRILSAFETDPVEPPRIFDETEWEQQWFREIFGMPVQPPKRHEMFFPIHIIHFVEIPEAALEGNEKTF